MSRIRPVLLLNGARAGEWWTVDGTYFAVPVISMPDIHEVMRYLDSPPPMPEPPRMESYRAIRLVLFSRVLWVAVVSGTEQREMDDLAMRAVLKPEVVDKLGRKL